METNYSPELWRQASVRKYLLLGGLNYLAMSIHATTYVLFLLSRGANLWQASLVNICFMVTVFFMEVPTGAFADHYGRRLSIMISCGLMLGGSVLYFFSHCFWFFVLSEIIVGVGITFMSGALDAWLVDSLQHHGYSSLKAKVFRRRQLFEAGGIIIGSTIGSRLGLLNLALPWLASGIVFVLMGFYASTIKEGYRQGAKPLTTKLSGWHRHASRTCLGYLKNRDIAYVMFFGALLSLSLQAINMQWTKFFSSEYALSVGHLNWVMFGIALAKAGSGPLSKYVKRLCRSEKQALVLTQLLTATAILIMTQANGLLLATTAFWFHEIGRELFSPLKQTYLNNQISSAHRATVLSLDSMIMRIGSFSGLFLCGWLANNYSIKIAWLFSGCFLLLMVFIFLLLRVKRLKPKTDLS